MNILLVTHAFPPFSRSGAETYSAALAGELSRNHNVTVYTAVFDPLRENYSEFEWKAENCTVRAAVNNCTFGRFSETYDNPVLDRAFRRLAGEIRPDIVHFQHLLFHSMNYFDICREMDIPTVLHLHDFYYMCPNLGQRLFLNRFPCRTKNTYKCMVCHRFSAMNVPRLEVEAYNRLNKSIPSLKNAGESHPAILNLLRKAARTLLTNVGHADMTGRDAYILKRMASASLIISPSRLYRDFYRQFTGNPDIQTMDYGFRFPEKIPPLKYRPGEPLRVGFLGTISRHKGAHLLVPISKRLGNSIELHVWGNDRNDPGLSNRVKALPNAVFHGGYTQEDLEKVFSTFDILLFPSIWEENSPLVVHEAFMFKRPVLAAASGGTVELVGDKKNGFLFTPGNAGEACSILARLAAGDLEMPVFRPEDHVVDIGTHAGELLEKYGVILKKRSPCPRS